MFTSLSMKIQYTKNKLIISIRWESQQTNYKYFLLNNIFFPRCAFGFILYFLCVNKNIFFIFRRKNQDEERIFTIIAVIISILGKTVTFCFCQIILNANNSNHGTVPENIICLYINCWHIFSAFCFLLLSQSLWHYLNQFNHLF